LCAIGFRAIYSALRRKPAERLSRDPTRGMTLILLSIATSIDALAVGVSLAMLDVGIMYPCMVIGIVAAAMTAAGMLFGRRLGTRNGRLAEALGGLVLIGIGVKILAEHTFLSS